MAIRLISTSSPSELQLAPPSRPGNSNNINNNITTQQTPPHTLTSPHFSHTPPHTHINAYTHTHTPLHTSLSPTPLYSPPPLSLNAHHLLILSSLFFSLLFSSHLSSFLFSSPFFSCRLRPINQQPVVSPSVSRAARRWGRFVWFRRDGWIVEYARRAHRRRCT